MPSGTWAGKGTWPYEIRVNLEAPDGAAPDSWSGSIMSNPYATQPTDNFGLSYCFRT